MKHLDFKAEIVSGLIGIFSTRRHSVLQTSAKRPKVQMPTRVPLHLPIQDTTRKRYHNCSAIGVENCTNLYCSNGGCYLFLVKKHNCFVEYHQNTCFESNKYQSDSLDHVQTILLFKCQILPDVPFCVSFCSVFCNAIKILFLTKN